MKKRIPITPLRLPFFCFMKILLEACHCYTIRMESKSKIMLSGEPENTIIQLMPRMNILLKLKKLMDSKNNTLIKNTGNGNSGNWNSGNWNSGNWNSGDRNSGDRNSGDRNSGNWNSGYGNSTNRESGIFNNIETTVRCFGKDSGKKWDEIDHPRFCEFLLTEWISEEKMTYQEKIDVPEFHIKGGYLKRYEYKEAWANYWENTNDADRARVLALPNFDADIFLDITGIDVRKNKKLESKKQELLNKADELIKQANELKSKAKEL